MSYCHYSHFRRRQFQWGVGADCSPVPFHEFFMETVGLPRLTGSLKGNFHRLPPLLWLRLRGRHRAAPAAQDSRYLGIAVPFSLLLCELKWNKTGSWQFSPAALCYPENSVVRGSSIQISTLSVSLPPIQHLALPLLQEYLQDLMTLSNLPTPQKSLHDVSQTTIAAAALYFFLCSMTYSKYS